MRIGAAGVGAAVAGLGVRPFAMTGRPMRGIIVVAPDALDDRAPERWIGRARSYVAGRPPKELRALTPRARASQVDADVPVSIVRRPFVADALGTPCRGDSGGFLEGAAS